MDSHSEPRPFANLHESAYQAIRNAIVSGAYLPGEKLSIRGLAKSLGVSLTPVREALRRLSSEGAVSIEAYRSARIPNLSVAEIEELWFLRALLEGSATELACDNADATLINALSTIELKLEAARQGNRRDEIVLYNSEFHFTLYAASRRPRLCADIERLWLNAAPLQRTFIDADAIKDMPGRQWHAEVLKALRRSDRARAKAVLLEDLNDSLRRVLVNKLRLSDSMTKPN
jgi:GntR family colanic acid and biofilm gene transcriptional regulator